MVNDVVDKCVQVYGRCGFMMECPFARAYIDNRAHQIYGDTNQSMKELISRSL